MRSLFKAFLSVAAFSVTSAHYPFVGKHAQANEIVRDDGSVAVKMNALKAPYDKYASMVDKKASYKPAQSFYEKAVETIYGKSLEKMDFEQSVDQYLSRGKTSSSKKRLGDSHVVAVLDQTAYIWTAAVYMGRFTPMNVLFDTGSDWLVIEDVNCENCEDNKYDARQGNKISDELEERAYGTAWFKGHVYSDVVCIQLSACVSDFEYFAIQEQIGLREPIDGILGLTRGLNQFVLDENVKVNTTKSYVTAMKEEGMIDSETFSFYFNNLDSSYVDFGQYQETSTNGDIKYINALDDFFWSFENTAVAFGEDPDDKALKYAEPVYTIIDTSAPTLSISAEYFDKYVDAIFSKVSGNDYQVEQGQVLTQCDYEFPNLYFMFGDYWVEVKQDEYVLDVSEKQDRTLCILAIGKNTESFNIFGGPLLQDYYSIFDMEQGRIGFAPHTVSEKSTLADAILPSSSLSSTHDVMIAQIVTWCILISIAGGAAVLFVYLLYPFLLETFPNNAFYVVACSSAYFILLMLLLGYGLRPLFLMAMTVSPRRGSLATPENHRLEAIGTFVYLVGGVWFYYSVIFNKLKAKYGGAKTETIPTVEANSEQTNKLLELLKEVQQTNQIA